MIGTEAELTFATKRVVDSERSAAAVIGLSKLSRLLSRHSGPISYLFYCSFSRPRLPYRRAALQLGEAPSRLYIFGRLGSRAPRGPSRPGPPARQAVTLANMIIMMHDILEPAALALRQWIITGMISHESCMPVMIFKLHMIFISKVAVGSAYI